MPPDLRTHAARASLAVAIAALLAGAWLSFPRVGAEIDARPLVVLLVDTSASVRATRPSWAGWIEGALHEAALSARDAGSDVALVAFDDDVRAVRAAQPSLGAPIDAARDLVGSVESARGTRLAAALAFGRSLAAPRANVRWVVFGDGTWTGADPTSEIERALARGISIERVPPPAPELSDLGIGALVAPRALEVGAPLVVALEAWWTRGADASDLHPEFEFEIEHAGRVETRTVQSAAPPAEAAPDGAISVSWPIHPDLGVALAGACRVTARARLVDAAGVARPDPVPENDRASCVVRARGSIACALVGELESTAPTPGLDVLRLAPSDLDRSWASLDVVVTLDRPLDAPANERLAAFVRAGGGWLDLAGWNWSRPAARAPGAPAQDDVAPLGPAGDGDPPRDVIVLADASGSMSGARFESVRQALVLLLDRVPARDTLEVRFFAAELSAPTSLGDGLERADPTRRAALVERLRVAAEPRGPTRLWLALEALARERARADRDALVVLLSDGADPERDNHAARGAAARRALELARAKLAVLAVGPGADRDVLASLLAPGQALIDVQELAGPEAGSMLARSFEREIARSLAVDSPTSVMPVAQADDPLAEAFARVALALPDVRRHLRAVVAPGARLVWRAADGSPLGAIARVGRGLAATLAFAPTPEWAPAWSGRFELLAPLARLLGRARAERRDPSPEWRVERGHVVLGPVPDGTPAELAARARSSAGENVDFALEAGAPGRDVWRERSARIPAAVEASAARGDWTIAVDVPGHGPVVAALHSGRAPEFDAPGTPFDARPLARATPAEGQARPASEPNSGPDPRAPWVLALAVGSLLLAALLRVVPSRARP